MGMNVNITVSGTGGPTGSGGDNIQNKSLEDLGKMMQDPVTKAAALQELLRRLEEMLKQDDKKPPEDQMDPAQKQALKDALKSLKNGASGDTGGNLVSQVLQALGVPAETANTIGDAVAGGGGGGGGGGDHNV